MPQANPRSRDQATATVMPSGRPENLVHIVHRDDDVGSNRSQQLSGTKLSSKEASRATIDEVEIQAMGYEEDNYFRLQFFESSLLATVLEDTINCLRILEELNTSLRIIKVLDEMPMLKKMRLGIQMDTNKCWLDRVDPKRLTCLEYKLHKLSRDRSEVQNILMSTYINLTMAQSYRVLFEWIKAYQMNEDYSAYLHTQVAKNKIAVRDLHRKLRHQRNQQKSAVYDIERVVDDLVRRIEDYELTTTIEGRYVDNWQRARKEQHEETIRVTEVNRSTNIENAKMRFENEARIHQEIEMLISIHIHDTLQEIEVWMAKYEKDMESMDLKITIMKNEYQKAIDRKEELQQKFTKRAQEMADWTKFKEDRHNAKVYEETMKRCAIVVQAWWRGLLVRLQIGPYRPKRKPRAGPPKKK